MNPDLAVLSRVSPMGQTVSSLPKPRPLLMAIGFRTALGRCSRWAPPLSAAAPAAANKRAPFHSALSLPFDQTVRRNLNEFGEASVCRECAVSSRLVEAE